MDSLKRLRFISKLLLNKSKSYLKKKPSLLVIDYAQPSHLTEISDFNITYISSLKSRVIEAKLWAITPITELKKKYDYVIITVPKTREEALFKIALGYKHTKTYGTLIVEGEKRVGINYVIKDLAQIVSISSVIAKAHGKIATIDKKPKNHNLFAKWLALGEARLNGDGFFSTPGLFSYKKADAASKFLSETFNELGLTGDILDLGSGWGFLSSKALIDCLGVSSITILDNDLRAIQAAKLNIKSPKATFKWMHVEETSLCKTKFDTILCNPPFHYGREKDIKLGLLFIDASANLLKKNGNLLMVANVHLPYERQIEKQFKKYTQVKANKNYKIILANYPK